MKKLKVEDAVGQALCHDMTAILENGFKGVRFQRGHVITPEDLPILLDMGKRHVFVWDPAADEVHENEAAFALVQGFQGQNLLLSGPAEGKLTLTAETDGLLSISREGLRAVNLVEDYTAACLPNYTRVSAGQRVAGWRIVPLVTKRERMDQAAAAALAHAPVFSVLPFRPLRCGVIITGNEVYEGRIQDRFEPVMRSKLASLGGSVVGVRKCPDDLGALRAALDDFLSMGAQLIALTGGMSVDPDDVTPTAILSSGARIIARGMPMQPGNMLTLATLGDTWLLGIPGASLHARITSLDVFLPRIFADAPISQEEIAGLGEGGLCLGCAVCTYPVCYFGHGSSPF